jgi:hypothetical protein
VYLTAGQVDMLADESGRYRSLVLLLGVGGLRWGEAAALRVGDVNFLRRRVDLHRNVVQVGTKIVVGTLKSNENRAVVLPEFVIEALAEAARGKGRDDLFWPTPSGRYMGPPAAKDSWLSGAVARCRKADPTFPRVTAHALRHTAASLAISAGANPKVVQRYWGTPAPRCPWTCMPICSTQISRLLQRVWANCGQERRNPRLFDGENTSSSTDGNRKSEPPVRIELTTARLQGECSTTELRRPG